MIQYAPSGPAGFAYGVQPISVQTVAPTRPMGLAALAPHGLIGGWSQVGRYNSKVDHRLVDSLAKAAERFVADHPGYTVEAFSGYRPGDKRQHGKHRAVDVRIKDPSGTEVPNYQSAQNFRTYESLAQNFKSVVDQDYPELSDKARWGGYFSGKKNYGAVDLMHFDLGGLSGLGMLGGTWEKGLNAKQRSYYPGAVSIGMDALGTQPQVADVPTPTPRPDPTAAFPDLAGLQALQNRREYERPALTAPIGQVDRSPLADVPSLAALAPDRQMPLGDVRPSIADAFPSLDAKPNMGGLPGATAASRLGLDSFLGDQAKNGLGSFYGVDPAAAGTLAGSMVGPAAAPPSLPSSFMARPEVVAPNTFNAPAPSVIGTPPSMLSPDLMSPIPGAPPAATIAATPPADFPAAPPGPSKLARFAEKAKPIVKDAMLGLKLGGPLGALVAPAIGMLGDKLGIGFSHLGPGFDAAAPDRFSTGVGLNGIMGAMNGPLGAQGFSLSNPGSSFTSLGNGMGLRRSEKYGWTEVVGPSGSVVGIRYDDPDKKGILGSISKSMNGKFGGGLSEKGRDAVSKGKGGLY